MASIQSLGIGSGLLTSELVDDIIAAEREPVENRLNLEQEIVEAKISAYGEITSSVSSLSSSLQSLSLPSTFSASSADSTNSSLVSATASSVAVAGSYVVEVSQLAQSHSVASEAYSALDEVIGSGTLTFRFGTISFDGSENYESFVVNPDAQTKTVTIDSTNNTLAGIRDAVNAEDFGVQASIVDDGSGFRLLFSSAEGGIENSLEIVASGDDGISAFNYNLASETSSLSAVTSAGTTDLSSGAGLSTESKAFALNFNGSSLTVVVPSDPLIDTTLEVVAAVQSALDAELIANGFSAGDIIVSDDSDQLVFTTLATGFDTTLEVTNDGSAATLTGGVVISDGFDFSANNATFSLAVDGGTAQAITLNTATASRQETVDLINAALVTAGLDSDLVASLSLSDELVFTRTLDGSAATIEMSAIDVSGTAASSELGLSVSSVAGLDGFGLDTAEGIVTGQVRLSQTIAAQDANLTVNGLTVTRGSNLVAGVISGTTLNLKGVTSGPVTISVEKDASSLVESVQGFVDAYNDLKLLSDDLTAFDPSLGENGQGSLLIGDSTLRTVTSNIDSLLRAAVSGLTGSIRSLAEIGVTTDQNNSFQLTFDSALFESKYADDPDTIKALFANAGTSTDSQIQYVSSSEETQPGSYEIEIDALATVGSYQAYETPSLAAGNITIDDDNDNFSVRLNGLTSTVSLTHGLYATAENLAEQIQLQINSDSTYQDGNHSVTVSFNSTSNRFELASNIYGSSSEILFTAADANVADELGFLLADQGPFQTNQLGGLATPTGLSTEDFSTPLQLDADTSFSLDVDGISTGLITIPGSSGSPITYDKPDDIIAEISSQLDSDGAFLAQSAATLPGEALVAGMDFSGANRTIVLSTDGGDTEITVTVSGDSATTSFGGQTPGTLANSLAAVQDAIDATALNGVVTVSLDTNDQIAFSTVATGGGATLDVIADGAGAIFTGNAALNGAGFDFATTNATFDISVDSEAAISISISTLTTDPASTVQEVQSALDAAGIGNRVSASLDGSDQIVLTRSSDTGASTSIAISNANATANLELGLSNLSEFGTDGFEEDPAAFTGRDAKTVTIDYAYDSGTGLGRLIFSSDDQSDLIEFDDVSTNAANKLGIFIGDGTVTTTTTGTDAVGQINGIDANGSGQLLRAETGSVPAKPGFYLNTAIGNLSASTTADTFKVTVDGITSSAITLGTVFNPDPDTVAASLEVAINNNPLLLAAGVGVSVDYDTISGGFGIISNTTGVTSSVSLSEITGSAGTIFGFTPGIGVNGSTGTAAEGKPDPSAGLRVRVSGGALGTRGSVSFVRGIADQLDQLLDSFLNPDGLLSNRTSALNLELENIADERVDLTERLQSSEERLRSSFLANDLIISNLNTTADFLSSQLSLLEGLIGSSNGKDD